MTFTKEQLTRIIESADEVITALAGTNDDIHPDNSTKMCAAWDDLNDRNAPPSVVKKLAEMALAGMEAEPVSEFYHEARWGWYEISEGDSVPERARIPLYRVPPAPVSVPAITKHFDEIALETAREIMCDVNRRHEFLGGEVQLLSRIQCRIDDACRAAMLQAGNSPVIPDGWVIVPVEPTEDMLAAAGSSVILSEPEAFAVYSNMLAAAPQQEA